MRLPEFKSYVDARISYFDAGDDPEKINIALKTADSFIRLPRANVIHSLVLSVSEVVLIQT